MSEDIDLQGMRDDRQPGEENIYATLHSRTPLKKTGPSSSTIACYRCAVVCLGVVCLLLGIIIGLGVLWLKTTSDASSSILSREASQLQERCDAITAERDTLLQRTVTAKKQITQYAVDVTLDPDTANNYLILSADGKLVKDSDASQNRPDNPKRFDYSVDVLGKQGFSSGRFYYEVQVSGKTAWSLGVARESIDRQGEIMVSPTYGFWTIWLMDSEYEALANPDVTLSLKEKPERVGVFVDYGAGLVSFYDADRWSLIYSYKGVSFREKIYPYFSPYTNANGKNSAPLVITPVSCFKSF